MDELNELYCKNINLIDLTNKIINYFHKQNYDRALRFSTAFIDELNGVINLINTIAGEERVKLLYSYLENILEAQGNKDYILLSDLYEMQILKYFMELQEDIISSGNNLEMDRYYPGNRDIIRRINPSLSKFIDEEESNEIPDKYIIEFSSCGLPTLAIIDKKGKYYLHGNGRVTDSANTLAEAWYQEEVGKFVVYGFGLGYHIKELSDIDTNVPIEVYEADLNVIRLAMMYTDMGYLERNSNVRLIYDPDFRLLSSRINTLTEHDKLVIYHPSLRGIEDNIIREKLEDYFIQYSSIENQRVLLKGNFYENIKHYDGFVDELEEKFKDKDLYIVAAGPSLDKNFKQLANLKGKGIIMATGTVFRKLNSAGIKPDYVIVTDANWRVLGQIGGLENSDVPMLFLSTAYKGFGEVYQGKKYIICQKGYDRAEELASNHGVKLYNTGGSVSTTALDIGITFGCRRIIFIGLDLAFTDNFAHASDTSQRTVSPDADMRQTEDIYGKLIYTSKSMNIYRRWIENRIRDVKGIEFIDATEGGAKIKGMKIKKLKDCMLDN